MDKKICQSCSMPLSEEKDFGSESDGRKSLEYCVYCYKKGAFTNPNLSLEAMMIKLISMHDKMGISREEAKKMAEKNLPSLKRWKKT